MRESSVSRSFCDVVYCWVSHASATNLESASYRQGSSKYLWQPGKHEQHRNDAGKMSVFSAMFFISRSDTSTEGCAHPAILVTQFARVMNSDVAADGHRTSENLISNSAKIIVLQRHSRTAQARQARRRITSGETTPAEGPAALMVSALAQQQEAGRLQNAGGTALSCLGKKRRTRRLRK